MVDVDDACRGPPPTIGVRTERERSSGRRRRGRELAVAVGDRLLAVAWALAQGTGWLARWRQRGSDSRSLRSRAISDRRSSTPSGVSRCSRNPVDRGFALPGRSGPPHEISRPSAYTQARVLPSFFPFAAQGTQYQISSSPLAGALGVAPIGGRPMKPVRRTKSRTLPIAEPVPMATTSAAAATATSRRRRRWCAPERLSTSSQSGAPGVTGRRRSRPLRSRSVTFVPPPVGCVARRALH